MDYALLIRNLALLVMLAVVTYTDLKRLEIDDEVLIAGTIFIGIYMLLGLHNISFKEAILSGLGAGFLFYILTYFGMGGGDVKLIAVLGLFLGMKGIINTIFLSFVYGGIVAAYLMLFKKRKGKDEMPFGPSIALGAVTAIIFEYYNIFLL